MSGTFFHELEQQAKKLKTYAAIVLDSSGTMNVARDVIISSLTEQMQSIQNGTNDQMETKVLFVTFGDVVKIHEIVDVGEFDYGFFDKYRPNGLTPMLDAVGKTIELLQEVPDADDENTSFLLVIASDGLENYSKEHTYESVAALIREVKKTGRWTVTYLGANQDLENISKKLNIERRNTASFSTSSSLGYQDGMTKQNVSIGQYMTKRSVGTASADAFYNEE